MRTCRAWELNGIPCSYAICAMNHARIDPQSQISMWYHKTRYEATYAFMMQPMPGKQFMKCSEYEPIEPSNVTRQPGRPKQKRVRAKNEPARQVKNPTKLSKKGNSITCGNCGEEGHNRARCKKVKFEFHLLNMNDNSDFIS